MNKEIEQQIDNYIPFGPEWVKEVSKAPKLFIIEMVKKANLKRQEVEKELEKERHKARGLVDVMERVIFGLEAHRDGFDEDNSEYMILQSMIDKIQTALTNYKNKQS